MLKDYRHSLSSGVAQNLKRSQLQHLIFAVKDSQTMNTVDPPQYCFLRSLAENSVHDTIVS